MVFNQFFNNISLILQCFLGKLPVLSLLFILPSTNQAQCNDSSLEHLGRTPLLVSICKCLVWIWCNWRSNQGLLLQRGVLLTLQNRNALMPFLTCSHGLVHLHQTLFENIVAKGKLRLTGQFFGHNVFSFFSMINLSFIEIFHIQSRFT